MVFGDGKNDIVMFEVVYVVIWIILLVNFLLNVKKEEVYISILSGFEGWNEMFI